MPVGRGKIQLRDCITGHGSLFYILCTLPRQQRELREKKSDYCRNE